MRGARPRLAIYQAWGSLLSGQKLEAVAALLDAIPGDLAVTGFERGDTESTYLLGTWHSE